SRRMVPDLIDLYGGRVNVWPLWCTRTCPRGRASCGPAAACVEPSLTLLARMARMDARIRRGHGGGSEQPTPVPGSGAADQAGVELLDAGRLPAVGEDRARRVGGDGHLVADRLTGGVDLLPDLGHLAVGDVRPDEVGAVDDIDDEALASAGARRDDRHRAVERVHVGAVVERDRLG